MLRVSKCFCCCSLKYGFLTFAVISLLFRVCLALSFGFVNPEAYVTQPKHTIRVSDVDALNAARAAMPGFGSMAGWYAVTSGLLILAIYGIFQKRSIHLYPYIVVLILEIVLFIITCIIVAIKISAWILITMFIVGAINTYAIICLVSLYKTFKEYERNRPQICYDTVPLKTV